MRIHLIVLPALAFLALTGCSGTPAPPEATAIRGTLSLNGFGGLSDGSDGLAYGTFWAERQEDGSDTCTGSGGYDDVVSGAQIDVYDPSGAVVGVATLGPGRLIARADSLSGVCEFPFSAQDVPKHPLYQFGLGVRPRLTVTAKDAVDGVFLSLG